MISTCFLKFKQNSSNKDSYHNISCTKTLMKHVCSKYNDTLSNVKKILEEYHAAQIQLKITIQFLKSSISFPV